MEVEFFFTVCSPPIIIEKRLKLPQTEDSDEITTAHLPPSHTGRIHRQTYVPPGRQS